MEIAANKTEVQVLDVLCQFFEMLYPGDGKPLGAKAFSDWKRNRQEQFAQAMRDQQVVAKSNEQQQHRGVDGIGQVKRRMASSLEAILKPLFGEEALKDEKFMERLDKDNNFGFKPHYDKKATIIKS